MGWGGVEWSGVEWGERQVTTNHRKRDRVQRRVLSVPVCAGACLASEVLREQLLLMGDGHKSGLLFDGEQWRLTSVFVCPSLRVCSLPQPRRNGGRTDGQKAMIGCGAMQNKPKKTAPPTLLPTAPWGTDDLGWSETSFWRSTCGPTRGVCSMGYHLHSINKTYLDQSSLV